MDRLKHAVDGIRKIEFTKRTLFYVLGVVMVAAIGGVIIGLSTFLANRLNVALTADPNVASHVRFDTEGFEKLQLTK